MPRGLEGQKLATSLLLWLAVLLSGIQAQSVRIVFPKFKNEEKQERAKYYQADIVQVTYLNNANLRSIELYCTRSAEFSWGQSGWGLSAASFNETLSNAINTNISISVKAPEPRNGDGSRGYQFQTLPIFSSGDIVECAFLARSRKGDDLCVGFGYPFKYVNMVRKDVYKPLRFGPDGPIDAEDTSNGPSPTITNSAADASATEIADDEGPPPIATSRSLGTTFPTGPATGIETGASESPDTMKGEGLSKGAIVGIGAGASVLGVAIAALAIFFWRRRKSLLKASRGPASAPVAGYEGLGGRDIQENASTTYIRGDLEHNPRPLALGDEDRRRELGEEDRRHEIE